MSDAQTTGRPGVLLRRLPPRLLAPALPALAALLSGCATTGTAETPSASDTALRAAAQSAPASDGAIYAAGREIVFFEDPKARRRGDLVTIRLQEATNASKSSSTDTEKSQSIDMPGPTIAGRPVTVNGTPVLATNIEGDRKFAGKGSSTQQNQLSGSITAVVVDVLPNGNLVVEGEKWLRLNQGDELIRLRGVVRPFDVLPDNSVPSDRIADARISYAGRGALANANAQGWIARFFNSPLFPY
jgi:flagellar L-ring protein precursor FlgH